MGRKKKDTPSKAILIHRDVYDEARIVAAYRLKSVEDYLSEVLRPIVHGMLMEHVEDTLKAGGKPD